MNDISVILESIADGQSEASKKLLPLVYDELRKLAHQKVAKELPGQTLDATALVHEAFMRLVGSDQIGKWETIGHFYAAAAEAMRRILIEIARRKKRLKHGGKHRKIDIESTFVACDTQSQKWAGDMIDLSEALNQFSEKHPEAARLVNLRYFAGLTMEDVAKSMGISRRTAQRHWAFAKAWLYNQINADSSA